MISHFGGIARVLLLSLNYRYLYITMVLPNLIVCIEDHLCMNGIIGTSVFYFSFGLLNLQSS